MRITAPQAAPRIPLAEIDLYDPGLFANGDPHLVWLTLREQAPVFWQDLPDGRGFWSVTKFDDVCQVLSEHGLFTSQRGAILKMLGIEDPAGGHQMAVSDPPRHTHLREPQQRMLTSAALQPRIPTIRRAVRRLLAPLQTQRPWDLGAAMTALPMLVSGMLMGLPERDYPDLLRWGLMTVAPDDPEFQVDGDPRATLQEAHHQLFGYFTDQVAERRRNPGGNLGDRDLIGRLMTMRVAGSRLRDGEVVSNAYSVLLGANVNTGHVVTAAIAKLMADQAQYERWATDRRCFRSGVREALRWASPVVHFLRYARDDIEIRDVKIRKDDGVVAWIPSANRDEEMFTDPFRFDVARRPNRQIAFGFGPHTCIGAAAALITLHATFEEIFAAVERFEPAGTPTHLRSNFTGGITHLPVVAHLRPGARIDPEE
jgi:cytochrome P450